MDCSNKRSKPPSTRQLLYQQVQEQSSLCDVIIKVGLWEMRFHWCVLVASPFFENIYRNRFLEKQTGIIELNKWPATLVELSLLFLYGRKPNVTEANVDKLLDIAEFLLVPELKAVCIEFLKRTKVTLDNCMQMLELSCVYGLELPTCESFILGHLHDVLEQEGMLNATAESVKTLLADPTLSYVPAQKWFKFIIRWAKQDSERQCYFVEMFQMLDFSECDSDFINNIVAREPLVLKNKEELMKTLPTGADGQNDTVLIFQTDNYKSLTCLNLRTMLWCRIGMENNNDTDDIRQFRDSAISGVKNSTSSYIYKVYRVKRKYIIVNSNVNSNVFSVLTRDLSNTESSVSNVVINVTDDYDNSQCDIDFCSFANDTLVLKANTCRTQVISNALNPRIQCASTLYLGRLVGPDIEMNPIMAIQNHAISQLCCGDKGSIAMLSHEGDTLFIFNEPTSELESIQLKTKLGIEISNDDTYLAGFRNGFVLYDERSVVCISRLSGPSLKTKYLIKQLAWEKHNKSRHQYVFDGDRWFRILSREVSLEYVNHDDLMRIEDIALLPWKNIPLPSETERIHYECRDVFAVSLPKGITRCHVDCPHCKLTQDDQPRQSPYYDWDDHYSCTYNSSDEDDYYN